MITRRARLVTALGSLLACSCSAGQVHPAFWKHEPRKIAVLPVENASGEELDQVSFGGLLQSSFLGSEAHDIPGTLRGALEETIVLRGYELGAQVKKTQSKETIPQVFREALPADYNAPDFDAALYATIRQWRSSLGSPEFVMRYVIEMYHVPSGDTVFRLEQPGHHAHRERRAPHAKAVAHMEARRRNAHQHVIVADDRLVDVPEFQDVMG